MRFFNRGFTLIELMVTISVIGILSAVVYANVGKANPKARDTDRQADIRSLQIAIDQYKSKNGRYPSMGCTPGADLVSAENDCSTYILDLAPEYIPALPRDNKRGTDPGYAYVTNTNGTSYKIMALGTVESEVVTASHPFRRCENSGVGICAATGVCASASAGYQNTYALWGGFADGADDAAVKVATALVICK